MKIFRSALILLPLLVASNAAMLRKKGRPREQGNIRHRQLDEAIPSEVPTSSPGETTQVPTISPGYTEIPTMLPSPQEHPDFPAVLSTSQNGLAMAGVMPIRRITPPSAAMMEVTVVKIHAKTVLMNAA